MKTFKNILKTTGIVLLLIFITLCFGINAHMKGYHIMLRHYMTGTTGSLAPDFALYVTTFDQVKSVIYILAWFIVAFLTGKKALNNVFRGMMIYSTLPFIGLIGLPFLYKEGVKLGILMELPLIWGYPIFPLIISESSIDAIKVPLGIAMVLFPIGALIARKIAQKMQY